MSFEQLWAGWRRDYVMAATDAERAGSGRCVFCAIAADGEPSEANGIIWRDDTVFAVVNAYPYASGHLMVMPRRHVDELGLLTPAESSGLWEATRRAVASVEKAYDPDGINMGANLGRAAGAGIPDHLHLHVVPRWSGDTNFMTSVAGVRVMPESLTESWRRLSEAWPRA